MSQQQQPPESAIPAIQPGPLPFSTTVAAEKREVRDGEGRRVMIGLVALYHSTPAGMMVAIWETEVAKKIARDIMKNAKLAEASIIVPGDGSTLVTDADFEEPEGASIDEIMSGKKTLGLAEEPDAEG